MNRNWKWISIATGISVFWTMSLRAGIDELVNSLSQSDLLFPRAATYVPFIPIGWGTYRYYADSAFESSPNPNLNGSFGEQQASVGAVVPAYVHGANLLMAGLNVDYTLFNFKNSAQSDSQLWDLTPLAGYLRQIGDKSQLAVFGAPILTSSLNGGAPWNVNAYAGILGAYYPNDRWTWFYGGVYQNNFGQSYGYPYLGFNWIPGPHWNVCMVIPWPSVSYALNDRVFFQIGAESGGEDFLLNRNGREASVIFGSYNLMASAGVRLNKYLWLRAGAGAAGFRSIDITQDGVEFKTDIKKSAVFMIALEFRPTLKK
jgi:hypothetical protein